MFELSKEFVFDAAHTLNRAVDAEPSRRIHGHSYWAAVTVRGLPDPESGMLVDLGIFERVLNEVRDQLDHRYLDDLPGLGPATIENLCRWIWNRLDGKLPSLYRVSVFRKSYGDRCDYYGSK